MGNVFIRVDGGRAVGTGHVVRCITLAKALMKRGDSVNFILNQSSLVLEPLIKKSGAGVYFLPEDVPPAEPEQIMPKYICESDANATIEIIKKHGTVDWLVVDHYGIDVNWESVIRPHVKRIFVIDDLANRKHDCEILLDQNIYENQDKRYRGLLALDCRELLGPSYALLREEFAQVSPKEAQKNVENILVSFGGSDKDNFTGKVLEILLLPDYEDVTVNVVIGVASVHKDLIQELCNKHKNIKLHCQIDYMAKLMSEADLFVGACGSTSLEILAMGLPAIVIAIADNQVDACQVMADKGLLYYAGKAEEFDKAVFSGMLDVIVNDRKMRNAMSDKGRTAVNKSGVLKVVEAMCYVG